jgi:ectoine hydroxylase-related dioxygenase (phytanoyl-CoA dioxygenase family)
MVTVRLHLDDCDLKNGALKIVPGSHRHGRLGATDISKLTTTKQPAVCELSKGDALLMRPLLLHASSPAENPRHRRVLHIEYAMKELPNGLKWLCC